MRFIDLFAGIGGFRVALEELGCTCVFSSDIDKHCKQVYSRNFGDIPYGDIKEINADEIPDFDILTAGFPCQPFSYAGNLKGFEDKARGTLFFDVHRIIKHKLPEMFILENVKGIISHNKGETIKTILNSLEKLGYNLHTKVLNSRNFGVPQNRERWYCVGFKKETNFEFPEKTNPNTTLRDIVNLKETNERLNLSEFEQKRIKYHFDNEHEVRVKHDNSKYEPHTKKGRHGVYSFQKKDGTLRFHVGDFAKTQIQEAYYCTLDSFAPTIIAAREPKLWDIGRRLSIEECKKLQGFPDWFTFDNCPITQAKKQLGNSVTVPVIRSIAKNMLEAYSKNNESS